jgi:hypothetical protein
LLGLPIELQDAVYTNLDNPSLVRLGRTGRPFHGPAQRILSERHVPENVAQTLADAQSEPEFSEIARNVHRDRKPEVFRIAGNYAAQRGRTDVLKHMLSSGLYDPDSDQVDAPEEYPPSTQEVLEEWDQGAGDAPWVRYHDGPFYENPYPSDDDY